MTDLDAAQRESFRRKLTEVRTSRLTMPDRPPEKLTSELSWKRKAVPTHVDPAPPKPAWDLSKSIWAPRAKYADSRSLWDTDEVELKRFESDWGHMLRLGIATTILKLDGGDDDEEEEEDAVPSDALQGAKGRGKEEADKGVTEGEVEEVREVLWEHHDLLAQMFIHYAASDHDINAVELNAFSDFTNEFRLVDKQSQACKRGDFDRLFLGVNSKGEQARRAMLLEQKQRQPGSKKAVDRQSLMRRQRTISLGGMGGRKGALNRVEFFVCIVTIACHKYVVPGELNDVSEAVERLLSHDILARAAKVLGSVEDVNDFRSRFCYTEATDAVLRRHEASLRLLFGALTGRGAGTDANYLCLAEWMTFLRAVDLLEAGDISERDATLAFTWSRMVVANPGSFHGRLSEDQLHFEDFLEALCRTSILKALPYDHEIEQAMKKHPGVVTHAGNYLAWLKQEAETAYQTMMHSRATLWGADPSQPVARCVEHLLAIIIHEVEDDTAGRDDLALSQKEVELWCDQQNIG